jgi:hypothetical protein
MLRAEDEAAGFRAQDEAGEDRPKTPDLRLHMKGEGSITFFDGHPSVAVDFLSALYFFNARRLFCFLRLCKVLRASCFIFVLLVQFSLCEVGVKNANARISMLCRGGAFEGEVES